MDSCGSFGWKQALIKHECESQHSCQGTGPEWFRGKSLALTMPSQGVSLSTAVERPECCSVRSCEQVSTVMLVKAKLAELASRDEASLSFNKVGHLELASTDAVLELAYSTPLATAAVNGVICIADSDGRPLSPMSML